jgi:hypothetical protein
MIEMKTFVEKMLTDIQYSQKNKMFNMTMLPGVGHFQACFLEKFRFHQNFNKGHFHLNVLQETAWWSPQI